MRRFFAKSLLFIVGVNLLVKPLWIFLIDRTVQNRVGHEAYGTYTALFSLSVIFQTVLDFGLNNYNTRTLSQDPARFATQFPAMLGVRAILIFVYAIIELSIGFAMGYRGWEILLLCGTLTMQSLAILLLFIRSNIAAFQRFRLDGLLSVADRLLMIVLCGSLLFLPFTARAFRIEWFVGLQIICYLLAIIFGLYLLRRITHQPLRISFHLGSVWAIIRQGSPYALLGFLMAIYMRSDALIMERLLPDGKLQTGVYAQSSRLLDVANMIPNILAGILLPMFGKMLAERADVASIIRLSVNLLLPLSLLTAGIAAISGDEIMHLLYHVTSKQDGLVFAWLMPVFPAFVLMYVYSTLLTANGLLPLLNKIAAFGVLLSVTLNLISLPHSGALGAAFTASLTNWILAFCYIFFAARRNALPYHLKWISAHAVYVLLIAASCLLLHTLVPDWRLRIFLLVAIAALLILLLRFVSPRALQQFLQRR